MSINDIGNPWPEWEIIKKIGEGSFGKVFKAARKVHGVTSYAAIKVISIPQNEAEVTSLLEEGIDDFSARTYFEGILSDFINEIKLMEEMKGNTNIVSVEDYQVIEKPDKVGWDIYIRMELLTSFTEYNKDKDMSEAEVIKFGIDICSALEYCAKRKIIHRDIKPENIFVSSFGDYKVGDFGIARELEKTNSSLSTKGTHNYMAPEVKFGKYYDSSVDTYSLGLILYRLLNNNRLPFFNQDSKVVQYKDRMKAINMRLNGEKLQAPVQASKEMSELILKACAYNPKERFSSASEMKKALEKLKDKTETATVTNDSTDSTIIAIDDDSTVLVTDLTIDNSIQEPTVVEVIMEETNKPVANPKKEFTKTKTNSVSSAPIKEDKKSKTLLIVGIIGFVVVMAIVGFLFAFWPTKKPPVVTSITIPDVVGIDVKKASSILMDKGFAVEVVEKEYDDSFEGQVKDTYPKAGDKAEKDAKIFLYVHKKATNYKFIGKLKITKEDTKKDGVNLRNSPKTGDGTAVKLDKKDTTYGHVKKGTVFSVYEIDTTTPCSRGYTCRGWYVVEYKGKKCYIGIIDDWMDYTANPHN